MIVSVHLAMGNNQTTAFCLAKMEGLVMSDVNTLLSIAKI